MRSPIKTRRPERGLLFFAATAMLCGMACSGGASTQKTEGTGSTTESSSGSSSSTSSGNNGATSSSGSSAPREVTFPGVQPRSITHVSFVPGHLALGFGDGTVTLFDYKSGESKTSKASKAFEVAAVSPDGQLALLRTNPPAIVNFKGDLILQMNTVGKFESAAFNRNGVGIYVADEAGKVRIWGQAHSFEEDQHKEKLENYLNRQAPDFHVEFPPIRGPLTLSDSDQILVADSEGVVRMWDPTNPSSAKQIMKLDGHLRSMAAAEGYVYATAVTGQLKIGKTEGGYLPWTKEARGGMVAANRLATGMFWLLDRGSISARKTEDGGAMWESKVPDQNLCGLAVSDDAAVVAACVGNFVVLVDANSGGIRGYAYRDGENFVWKAM